MARSDLDARFRRLEELVSEIERFVPTENIHTSEFRADLAGLLVVSIAACYESCVKDTLVNFAGKHHVAFGTFAANNYKRLNSRIALHDLHEYAGKFDDRVASEFKSRLSKRKKSLDGRLGKNIEASYQQILSWRHDFAHAGIRNTTIAEAMATHRLAKRVLYSFDEAFGS